MKNPMFSCFLLVALHASPTKHQAVGQPFPLAEPIPSAQRVLEGSLKKDFFPSLIREVVEEIQKAVEPAVEKPLTTKIRQVLNSIINEGWNQPPESVQRTQGQKDGWETLQAVFKVGRETITICYKSHALDPDLEFLVVYLRSDDRLFQLGSYPDSGTVCVGEAFNLKTGLMSYGFSANLVDDEQREISPDHVGQSEGLQHRKKYEQMLEQCLDKVRQYMEAEPFDARLTI